MDHTTRPAYLTAGGAARRAGVGERTIYTWLRSGELPVAGRAGNIRLIDPADLDAVVAARRQARNRR
jgi:excisionase family DNA binding protein